MKQPKQLQVVHIPSLDVLPPEASAETLEFELQKIRSLIAVPMVYRGALVGFLGLDSGKIERTWADDTMALLRNRRINDRQDAGLHDLADVNTQR